jgi:hypothetical protein
MGHHVDVCLVQVLPDPSMVWSDVNRDFPSAHIDLPPSLPPGDTEFGGPHECDRAAEIGEIEPVRDDPLERRISLADSSAVRPSIVEPRHTPATAASPSGRRSTNVTESLDPGRTEFSPILQTMLRFGTHDNATTPGASCGASPPTSPSCSTIGCPGSLKGYTGESGETDLLVGGCCVLMTPS